MERFEYRGVSNLVYAEVLKDDETGYETGDVKPLAPVAEIGKNTEASRDPHYYDNEPLIIVDSVGVDEVKCTVAGIPVDVVADITGQYFDKDLGMLVEGDGEHKNFAIGYKTKRTDGKEVYVWRLKGTFAIPEEVSSTEDDGTDANGQELTYTGVKTIHKFTKNGNGARAVVVHEDVGNADLSTFFDAVTTPDTLKAKTA